MDFPNPSDPQIIELTPNPTREITEKGEDEDDEDIDETLTERLLGLTEMFPESLRKAGSSAFSFTGRALKSSLAFSKSALWVISSGATILVLPMIFENERAQLMEQQKQQERQILLGPHAAVSGQQGMFPGMMPPNMAPPS